MMKAGRVIGGDEHDACTLANQIVADARAEAEHRRALRVEFAQLRRDADELAKRLVQDARSEAERTIARAEAEAVRMRDDARVLANRLVEDVRAGSAAKAAPPADPATSTVDEGVWLVMRATVPGVALGEIVRIDRRGREPLAAEVVGFRGEQAVLLPALCGCAATMRSGRACRTGLG